MAQVLQLLSEHPDAQAKVRREILEAGDGYIPYEKLHSLPYLDAICKETLRMWAPSFLFPMLLPLNKTIIPGIRRLPSYYESECSSHLPPYHTVSHYRRAFRDTTLPLSQPMRGSDGSILEQIPILKGTNVLVGVRACNRNKALWGEDAEEWKPERWLAPLPKAVEDASIPGVYSNLYAQPVSYVALYMC